MKDEDRRLSPEYERIAKDAMLVAWCFGGAIALIIGLLLWNWLQ